MSFPRYERYKDSGVEWLGEVPEHWDRTKLRRISIRYSGGTPDKTKLEYWDDGTIPWLSSGEVSQSLISKPSTFITEDAFKNSSAKWIPSGALVMALAGQGKTKGTVAQLAIPSTCNQSMAAIVPREMSQARFLFWWLSANYQNIRNMAGGDLRDGLNLELLGDIDCPLVPEPERMAIATFLDMETANIDELIEEQRRLIELLKEKRQAVISHAVTKGLNPDAPMKDSGIEWIGSIPARWTVLPLKRYLDFLTSGSRGWAEHYSDSGALFIRIGNLTRENIHLNLSDIQRVVIPDGAEGLRTKVEAGDVLFSITAFLGSVAVVPAGFEDAYVSQHVALARIVGAKLDPSWVAYTTLSVVGKTYLDMQGYGGTKIQLGLDDIANLIQVVPPIEEQRSIIRWLDSELSKYESLRDQAERGIYILQERRSALISAAVTGKIDVRNYIPKEAA